MVEAAVEIAEQALARVVSDLGMILDQPFVAEGVRTERVARRAAGEGSVHISFKLAVSGPRGGGEGCFLLPLREALTLAALLMLSPEDEVLAVREAAAPDHVAKDALLEIGNFIACACDGVLRERGRHSTILPAGCQGVRADVRPALDYREGESLLVVRARARIGAFEPFELLAMLPEHAVLA